MREKKCNKMKVFINIIVIENHFLIIYLVNVSDCLINQLNNLI